MNFPTRRFATALSVAIALAGAPALAAHASPEVSYARMEGWSGPPAR